MDQRAASASDPADPVLPFGIGELSLIDHHCHAVTTGPLDEAAFASFINEGFADPAAGTSHFDTPIGLAVRRWCAPILDLEPFVSPQRYVERRAELGGEEASRRMLAAAGLGTLLIDTGYTPDGGAAVDAMASLSGSVSFEVVRIESVLERVASSGVDASAYAGAVEEALERAAATAVGFKTIVAYRGGFGIDPTPPSAAEVERAAAGWIGGRGPVRASDPVVLRHGLWTAATVAHDREMPIQIHAGFGDPDLTLHTTNPTLLTDLVKAFAELPVNVVFLHCYPYHREAGYLASMFPNAYFDIGAVLHYVGPSAPTVMAEALELAPFTKQLFSSDAYGVAELYLLGALGFRRALAATLTRWVDAGDCSGGDAERIVRLIGRENALRVYPIEP